MNEDKLIAEFMKLPTEVFKSGKLNYKHNDNWFEEHELSYDVCWKWLMPVVRRFGESDKYLGEQDEQDLMQTLLYGHRDDVYQLIVEFIKEYNKYE